ncbi:MAG TPA: biopolymer transporter ExbD [Gammaproteobacteria bacterium]|nr:biopolymer transporter ExbD [Gammaproteobacteria bacterium]
MKRRWRKKHLGEPAEVNITAFMNLMVILVPFLLITAVFSRITILELNLPTPGTPGQQSKQDEPEKLELEVIVRQEVIEIGDRKRGLLKLVKLAPDGSHLQQVSDMLQQIKARFPDKTDITLLMETDISYERLVEMMDTLRVARVEQDGETINAELFPAISIGDAPPAKLRTAKRNGK